MTPSTNFKDRLLAQLKKEVAERPASELPQPHPAFRRRRQTRFALATGGCAAALAAIAIFSASGSVATKAYAVKPQPSGLVMVSIRSLEDGKGLQESLQKAGVPAVVEFNDDSDLPPLRDRLDLPPQFRAVTPSQGSVGCMGVIPEAGFTIELPYPESLADLASIDPSLRPTLLASAKKILNPAGLRSFLRRQKKWGYDPAKATTPPLPPFTFVPNKDLIPPSKEEGVTLIVDPNGLEPGERLHIVTTQDGFQSMTAFSKNAVCLAGGE